VAISNPGLTAPAAGRASAGNAAALAVLSTVFFMWGFVTVLNDILVPHLKSIFALNYAQSMLVQFTFFSAYFLVSLPAAAVISRIGYHRTIVLGLTVMAGGALLFIPAARLPSYGLFLGALWVLASGITFLQVSANPYVAVLGPASGSSSRLNLVQALNSLGTTVGPWVGGLLILSTAAGPAIDVTAMTPAMRQAYRAAEASTVIGPYLGIAVLLLTLAVVIARFRLPVLSAIEETAADRADSVWRHPHLLLGVAAIFAYVGAEVAIGSFLVSYLMQPDIAGVTAPVAARYVSLYWGGAMVGRFAGSAVLRYVSTGRAVGTAATIAGGLIVCSILSTGTVAMAAALLVGLFNSIMFPSIFTLGIAELGPLTSRGSGLLIAAIVGGAIVPLLQGVLADRIGLHLSFVLPVLCYAYVVFYGFVGSIPRRRALIPNPQGTR
jgi:FHS family L-fucose permease-like MFS transporter